MFKWLKKLAASKILINITIHEPFDPNVKHTTTPEVIEYSGGISLNRVRRSDFRFVCDAKTDYHGGKSEGFYTEEFRGGSWHFLTDTYASSKEKGMALHLEVVQRGTLEPTKKKIVIWEGLDKEETKTWVAMQTKEKSE